MSIAVSAIVPSSDRIAGGVAVTILGSGFVATPTVSIGGTAATSVVRVSATRLTCVIPAHAAGAVNVVVTNPDTTNATLTNGFTFYAPASRDTAMVSDFGGSPLAVRWDSVTISKANGPGQAQFVVDDARPVPQTSVRFGLGSLADADLMFRGKLQDVGQSHEQTPDNYIWNGTCVDSTAEFNRHLAFGSYVAVAADVVALDLLTKYAPDFTGAHVVAGLDPITIMFDGGSMDDAFNQIADLIGGYYYRDNSYDVHLFITETPDLTPDPIDYTALGTTVLNDPALTFSANTKNLRNRVIGIGAASQALQGAAVGDTSLALVADDIFDASGTVYVANGAQRITYAAKGFGFAGDLTAWTLQAQPAAVTLNHAVWAEALGLFVAVGVSTAATSPDGKSWTVRTTPTGTMTRVAWSPTLGLLAAPDSVNGKINTSPDGITWTARSPSEANAWTGITWADGLGLFVTVSTSGTHRVATSADGTTWTVHTAASAQSWTQVVWAPALNTLVAQASGGTTSSYMTSPDGTTWTTRTSAAVQLFGLTWAPALSLFVSVGTASIYTSPTGVTWTAQTLPSAINLQDVLWIAELGQFIAVDATTTRTSVIFTSADAVTWSVDGAPATGEYLGIAWSPALGRILIIDANTTRHALTNDSTIFGLLTGIPAVGVGSITTAINAGDAVALYSERNDLTSQALLMTIEGGKSTGVYEFKIPDGTITSQAALDARCDADLFQNSDAGGALSVAFTTFDRKVGYGKPLSVDIPWRGIYDPAIYDPAIFDTTQFLVGDFIIQSVSIANIDEDMADTPPRYAVVAASKRLTMTTSYLLRHAIGQGA